MKPLFNHHQPWDKTHPNGDNGTLDVCNTRATVNLHGPCPYLRRPERCRSKEKTSTTGTVQNFINLLSLFLEDFKSRGCHVVCDLAYMGELLAMVARDVWLINIIGTTQINRCGADGNWVKSEKMKMEVGTYECIFFLFTKYCNSAWHFGRTTVLLPS